jgi:D-alanine-D-alanine ligase
MLVGFTYDLRQDYLEMGYSEEETAEFDSPVTVNAIDEALSSLGFRTERIGHAKNLVKMLAEGKRWDFVFNICEGVKGYSRESQVQCLLDAHNIPYTFSDPVVTIHTLHKSSAKAIVRSAGGRTPDYAIVKSLSDLEKVNLDFPLFAKPIAEGTGKGITTQSILKNKDDMFTVVGDLIAKFQQAVLLETYLPGREFTVGVVGTGATARVVGVMEIALGTNAEQGVYSFNNKEFWEGRVTYKPLLNEPLLKKECEDLVLLAWHALGCRDGGRIDLRLDKNGHPHFLEVNPMAGMNPEHSDLPILASFEGIPYKQIVRDIVHSALDRVANSTETQTRLMEITFPKASPMVHID